MTTQPPAGDVEAREAALKEAIDVYNFGATNNAKNFRDPVAFRAAINHAIDRYLAKLTPAKAEPSRIAEIRERSLVRRSIYEWDDLAATLKQAEADRKDLLPHITAIEADKDRMREAAQEAVDAMSSQVPSPVAVQHASVEWKRIYEAYHKLRSAIARAALTPTNPDREG